MNESPLITRRRSLALLAGSGSGLLLAGRGSFAGAALAASGSGDDYVAGAASCHSLTAEQEEGPYYVAVERVREEITLGQKGVPLRLEVTIIDTRTCKPLKNAGLDIWHCNAAGVYSDESSESTLGQTWLRGVQFTDKHGLATFHSIYPGHYSGRTTHIHVKAHVSATDRSGKLTGGHVAHTGNLFPPDAVNSEVYALSPYRSETAAVVTHAQDRVYTDQHGSEARMTVARIGSRLSRGLVGRVTLGVDPTATPALIGVRS